MVKRTRQLGWITLALAMAVPAAAFAQYAPFPSPPPQATASWTPPWSNVARQPPSPPHPAVARIVVPEKGATSYGSGTLVDARGDYGLVITNWHVVRDATGNITVIFPDGFQCAARVLKTDKDWDLAALAVWRPKVDPITIAPVPPQPGDVLTIAGYGSGNYRAATGRCTQFVSPGDKFPYEMVEVSTEARQGDSGGPMFNTRGELAGVLFGAGQGTTSGSHASRVRWFLSSLAPDLGRPDTSNIASSPPREGPAVAASQPPVKPFAPAIVHAPPANSAPRAKPQTSEDAIARAPSGGLTAVAPVESHVSTSPTSSTFIDREHVASSGFGAPPGLRPLAEPAITDTKPSSLEARVDLSRPAPGITWQAMAGDTLVQQTKTVLAAIGVLALLFHGLRLTGKSSPPAKAKKVVEEDDDE